MSDLVVAAAIVGLIAGIAQAVTGFGFSLVSIPLLALTTDSHTAIVGVIILSTFLTLVGGIRERGHVEWPTMRLVTVAGLVGMPIGLLVLHTTSERALTIIIGVMVLLSAIVLAKGLHLRPRTSTTLVAGGLSGALLTATGMNGPPLVAAFQAMGLNPRTFRATLQATFCVQDLLGVIGFVVIGQVTSDSLVVAAAGVPGVLIGWFVGDHAFRRIPPHVFRVLVLALMSVTGLVAVTQALMS